MNYKYIPASTANYTSNRAANGGSVRKITVHHMAGFLSVEQLGSLWQNPARQGSSHYGVNGWNVGQYVKEEDIAWTDSNWESNKNSVTIEVANSGGAPDWPVSAESLEQTALLCADIAKRNGLGKLAPGGNLTWHSMYAATECPGNFLRANMQNIANRANEVNAGGSASGGSAGGNAKYKVQIGAFKDRANADNLAAQAKATGFESYVANEGGMYKVQIGAFNDEANARTMGDRARAAGFEVYIAGLSTQGAPAPAAPAFVVGTPVRVKKGAADYNGTALAAFVYDTQYYIRELAGDRAVIAPAMSGPITAAVSTANLYK